MSTKNEIFDYVMNSPENTNPAVLGSMLNNLESGGDTGDPLIVTFSGEYGNSCDKTFAEIKSAFESGRRVYATLSNVSGDIPSSYTGVPLTGLSDDGADFSAIIAYGDYVRWVDATISPYDVAYTYVDTLI